MNKVNTPEQSETQKEAKFTSMDGVEITVDLERSHAATHIAKEPKLLEWLQKIIEERTIDEMLERFETDMEFPVGKMDLVETAPGDKIFYAKRPNRQKYNRFVEGKEPVETSIITTDIKRNENGEFYVHTVYIGRLTPKSPGGGDEEENSWEFWMNHALVAGGQKIDESTKTTECPWQRNN